MTLKQRLLILTGATTILVAAVVWLGGFIENSFQKDQITESYVSNTQALLRSVTTSRIKQLANESTGLTRNSDLMNLLKQPEAAAISEAAMPTFIRLQASQLLDQMIITDLSGNIMLNAPDNAGTPLSDSLLRQALSEKKTVYDYVGFSDGKSGILYAFPLFRRGKPVGAAAYIQYAESLATEIAESSATKVLIYDNAAKLTLTTDPDIAGKIGSKLHLSNEPSTQTLSVNDRHYTATVLPVTDSTSTVIGTLVTMRDDTESYQARRFAEWASFVAGFGVLFLALAIMYWQIKQAFVPIHKAVEAMNHIADGDLTQEISCGVNNEISDMLSGMAQMQINLRNTIAEVFAATEDLNKSAVVALEMSKQTSLGAQKQRQDTDSVATAMTEMSSTARDVAQTALTAAEATGQALKSTKSGQDIVNRSIQTINQLATGINSGSAAIDSVQNDSEAINRILEVIKSIAEQTNLLALNAAIEAARAGEQGRGFAVVADEVRTLASRTQDSTTEIYKMIESLQNSTRNAVEIMSNSSLQAERSVAEIAEAGQALEQISESVERASMMNTQIASAADQQGQVAEEINHNVVNIANVAETTADGANQTTSASDNIFKLADKLKSLMQEFRV